MDTIVNTSIVTDHAGETPVVTYSNPVTTVIRQDTPAPTSTRFFYNLCRQYRNYCCDCDRCCDCCCNCN